MVISMLIFPNVTSSSGVCVCVCMCVCVCVNMLQGLGIYLDQISAICSKRALFPYNDSCHVKYSAHELSVP